MHYCILTRIYCDNPLTQFAIPISDGYGDAILIEDRQLLRFEVVSGTKLTGIAELNAIPVNYTVGPEFLMLKNRTDVVRRPGELTEGRKTITIDYTLWRFLNDIRSFDGVLIEDDLEIPLTSLAASRTTDSIYCRYLTAEGYRTKVITNLLNNGQLDSLRFKVDSSKHGVLVTRYGFARIQDGLVVVDLSKAKVVGLTYHEFYSIASPSLFVFQQSLIEEIKVSKLACWFADLTMRELYKVEMVRELPAETRPAKEKAPSQAVFSVSTVAPSKAELKGILYGCNSQFFLAACKTGLKKPAEIVKYLNRVLPQQNGFYPMFKDEFVRLMSVSDVGYDAYRFFDFTEECNAELAQQYMNMCNLKSMLLEYDYYPEVLLRGVSLDGTSLKVLRGVNL